VQIAQTRSDLQELGVRQFVSGSFSLYAFLKIGEVIRIVLDQPTPETTRGI
jgi:hypothetical protein